VAQLQQRAMQWMRLWTAQAQHRSTQQHKQQPMQLQAPHRPPPQQQQHPQDLKQQQQEPAAVATQLLLLQRHQLCVDQPGWLQQPQQQQQQQGQLLQQQCPVKQQGVGEQQALLQGVGVRWRSRLSTTCLLL
jgi:hypothetical protein